MSNRRGILSTVVSVAGPSLIRLITSPPLVLIDPGALQPIHRQLHIFTALISTNHWTQPEKVELFLLLCFKYGHSLKLQMHFHLYRLQCRGSCEARQAISWIIRANASISCFMISSDDMFGTVRTCCEKVPLVRPHIQHYTFTKPVTDWIGN